MRILAAVTAAMLGSACTTTTPVFDDHFGTAVRTLQAQQTRNPEAPVANSTKLPDGIDGRTARESIERYHRSYAEPVREPSALSIGVGTASGAGSR